MSIIQLRSLRKRNIQRVRPQAPRDELYSAVNTHFQLQESATHLQRQCNCLIHRLHNRQPRHINHKRPRIRGPILKRPPSLLQRAQMLRPRISQKRSIGKHCFHCCNDGEPGVCDRYVEVGGGVDFVGCLGDGGRSVSDDLQREGATAAEG